MSDDFVTELLMLPSRCRAFRPGELVFEREDLVVSFYLVEGGSVHLLRRQMDGSEFILQRAGVGDVLGEASLSTQKYHCAAVAIAASELRIFDVAQVKNLLAENGQIALAYARYLGRELRNARLRAEIIFLRRVEDRLDAWLVWNENKLPAKGEWRWVASEIGVSPEALYRELARRRKSVAP